MSTTSTFPVECMCKVYMNEMTGSRKEGVSMYNYIKSKKVAYPAAHSQVAASTVAKSPVLPSSMYTW